MTSEALLARLQSSPGAVTPTVRLELRDGAVSRGEVELGCLLIVDSECKIAVADSKSAMKTEMSMATLDTNSHVSLPPLPPPLSMSTPTPRSTAVSILGLSVYDLKDVSGVGGGVFRLSPQVRLACNSWKVETNIAQFAGMTCVAPLVHHPLTQCGHQVRPPTGWSRGPICGTSPCAT